MTFAILRLNEDKRAALLAHFIALPQSDRSLRFGVSLATTVIAAYVDRIDFARDAVFGVHDDQLVLIGIAHVAIEVDRAELGLSVLPTHRRCGVGSALFDAAVAHASSRRIPTLFMQCRAGNAAIMRIAQRFGMDIISGGGDAAAHLRLQPRPVKGNRCAIQPTSIA